MDYANLARLLVRISALFVIVQAIGALPTEVVQFVLYLRSDNLLAGSMGILALVVVPGVAGLLLFAFAGRITNHMFAGAVATNLGSETSRLERVALVVLGWYFLASAVFEILYLVSYLHAYRTMLHGNAPPPQIMADGVAKVVAVIAKTVIGIGFILGARGIVAVKDRLTSRFTGVGGQLES
jgi:hypothetical protein